MLNSKITLFIICLEKIFKNKDFLKIRMKI